MIIKFEVNGAWQIFDDVDSLMYRKLGKFDLDLEGTESVIDYTNSIHNISSGNDGTPYRVLLTFMNSKQLSESQVVAFSPIYLMNNQGRTIETIQGE
jgi:hypothetical protein